MSDSLADFHARLFSIRPFTETLSPPGSPRERLRSEEEGGECALRRAASEHCEARLGESNHKTISSISSTIDMLFSKIEKIKEEFSYALDRPPTPNALPSTLPTLPSLTHFHSQKAPEAYSHADKENVSLAEPEKTTKQPALPLSFSKHLLHSHSLPLQDHNDNIAHREYFSDPTIPRSACEQANPFGSSPGGQGGLRIGDFQLGRCMGSGKFGDVYMSVHRASGWVCAIKKIFKSTIREYGMEGQLAREVRVHYGLAHPQVVQLYGLFDDEYHIFLLMEYACDGSLIDRLRQPEPQASRAVAQLLAAVEELHRRRVVHRDIKPENIVCSMGVAKLCDFGWAAELGSHVNPMKRTFCGTLDYVSPEMKDVGLYNESVDLWSIGVLTFELLAGFPPHKHEIAHWRLCGSNRSARWNWEVIYPPDLSPSAVAFIDALLKENPLDRPSLAQCRLSPFILAHEQLPNLALQAELDLVLHTQFNLDC